MFRLYAADFQDAILCLHQAIGLTQKPSFPFQNIMTDGDRKSSEGILQRLSTHVATLGCQVTGLAIEDMRKQLSENAKLPYYGYAQLSVNLSNTLKNELTLKRVYALDSARAAYFEPQEALFGAEVATKFPSLVYEIDQLGKCYACDLTTASAFHSIRCLEAGIRAIARCLGIPDPTKGKDRNWSNVIKAIKVEVDTRWPPSGRLSGDGALFDEIYGSLTAIQNPYRNATMHLDATYTAPEALHIQEVVKGLMVRIASRMDENGLPLA